MMSSVDNAGLSTKSENASVKGASVRVGLLVRLEVKSPAWKPR